MKALMMCLLGLAVPAGAQQTSEDPTRQLQNLVYYPHAGQFLLTPDFNGTLQNSGQTINNNSGAQTSSRNTYSYSVNADLGYGIIDGLRVHVREQQLIQSQTVTTNQNNGVQTTNVSHGLSDPILTAVWRLHDSSGEGLFVDLLGSVTVPFGHALNANGQSGNNLSGGWKASASLPIYWLGRLGGFENEFEFAPGLNRNFGSLVSGTTPRNSVLTSSYWSGNITFADRFHIARAWYVQPGVVVNLPYTYNTQNQGANSPNTHSSVDAYASPVLHIGYLPAPWLLFDATFTYIDNSINNSLSRGINNNTQVQSNASYAGLQARITF